MSAEYLYFWGLRVLRVVPFLFILSCETSSLSGLSLKELSALDENTQIDFSDCEQEGMRTPLKRHCWSIQKRGKVPSGARMQNFYRTRALGAASNAIPQGVKWKNVGPKPIRNAQWGAVSGRADAIAVDPTRLGRWLLGSASGGILETRDFGVTWSPITDSDNLPLFGIGAIAFDPGFATNKTIYAGTGEPFRSSDSYGGDGILKSTDDGKTWSLLNPRVFENLSVSDIAINPQDPNTLVATTVLASKDRNYAGRKSPGIYLSADGGLTWAQKLAGEDSTNATDLDVHPQDFQRQIAGMSWGFGSKRPLVVRTLDGGQSWSALEGPVSGFTGGAMYYFVKLALAKSNPNIAYVGIGHSSLLGLWRSNNIWDQNPTWEKIDTTPTGPNGYCNELCWYANVLSVAPNNPDLLYAGGIHIWRYNHAKHEWKKFTTIHPDQHAIAWENDRLIAANDGGVYTLEKSWFPSLFDDKWVSKNENLSITQFARGEISKDGKYLIGGAQDNGTSIGPLSEGGSWKHVLTGDGFSGALVSSQDIVATTQELRIWRSKNGGKSWKEVVKGIDRTTPLFGTRLAVCPVDPSVVIAGTTNKLYRTDSMFSEEDPIYVSQHSAEKRISALAFKEGTCDSYVTADMEGNVYLTSDAGSSWQELDRNLIPSRFVTEVLIDPRDKGVTPRDIFVALGGFARGHLYHGKCGSECQSSSANWRWEEIGPPIDVPHETMVFDVKTDSFFVGTDVGVFMLKNASRCIDDRVNCEWDHFGLQEGLPHVIIGDLVLNEATRTLVAFTYGRGAYVLNLNDIDRSGAPNR